MSFFDSDDWRRKSPTFWWPEDRSWFINTGYDSNYTVIAGSAALIQALCEDPELECVPLSTTKVRGLRAQ